jgi:hypothetical protein
MVGYVSRTLGSLSLCEYFKPLKTTKYAHTVITHSSAEYIGQSAAYQCDGRIWDKVIF